MFCADIVAAEPARFLEGELDDLLDPRGRDDLLDDDALVADEEGFHRLANHADFDAQVGQHMSGQPLVLS